MFFSINASLFYSFDLFIAYLLYSMWLSTDKKVTFILAICYNCLSLISFSSMKVLDYTCIDRYLAYLYLKWMKYSYASSELLTIFFQRKWYLLFVAIQERVWFNGELLWKAWWHASCTWNLWKDACSRYRANGSCIYQVSSRAKLLLSFD